MRKRDILDRIYPSVVTFLGDWKKMLKEVQAFGLKKISLFLTATNFVRRKEIYDVLIKSKVRLIPHVHARQDMNEEELEFLVKRFHTKAFSLHYQYLDHFKNSRHKKKIYIENNDGPNRIANIKKLSFFGGVCIDLSHLYEHRMHAPKLLKIAINAAKHYKVGCNHLSAVMLDGHSRHVVRNIQELKYVQEIPKIFFSNHIAIELANPIKQQLYFKKYIADILYKQWNKKYLS